MSNDYDDMFQPARAGNSRIVSKISSRNVDDPSKLTRLSSMASESSGVANKKEEGHCKACHDHGKATDKKGLTSDISKPKIESVGEMIQNFKPIVQSLLHSQNIVRRKALFHVRNSKELNSELRKIEMD